TTKIVAEKQTPTVTVEATQVKAGENTTITGKVTDENSYPLVNVPVTVEMGDAVYPTTTDDEGNYNVDAPVQAGENTITVKVGATDTTLPANATTNIVADKQTPTLTLEFTQVKAGQNTTITGKVTDENANPVADAIVNVEVANTIYPTTTDDDGKYNITATTVYGDNIITVKVDETDITLPANITKTMKANKQTPTLTLEVTPAKAGQNTTITGKVTDENANPVSNIRVTVGVGNNNYTAVTDVNGTCIVVAPLVAGDNIIALRVRESNTTLAANTTTSITAEKQIPDVISNMIPAKVGENATISGKVTDEVGNPIANTPVTVKVGDEEVTVTTTSKGNFNASVLVTKDGTIDVSMILPETSTTIAMTKDLGSFDADKQASIISILADEVLFTGDNQIMIKLTDDKSNPISTQIKVYVNDEIFTATTDEEGKTSIDVVLVEDTRIIAVFEGDSSYNAVNDTMDVTVIKRNATLNIDVPLVVIVGENTVTVTLKDAEGNAIADAGVTVTIDEEIFDVVTDTSGNILINYNFMHDAKILASYDGNLLFESTTANVSVSAVKRNATLTINADKKVIAGDSQFTITLRDDKSNPIVGETVIVTVGDDVDEVTTDANGSATLTAEFLEDKEITAKYGGNDVFDEVETSVNVAVITEGLLVITHSNSSSIVVSVLSADGSIVNDGKIAIKINGKVQRGADGRVIYLNVTNGEVVYDYQAGDAEIVKIQAMYSGSKKYAKTDSDVEILNLSSIDPTPEPTGEPAIIVDNITTQMGSSIEVKVKVVNVEDLNSGKVVLKINGKTVKTSEGKLYSKLTDGEAVFVYDLPKTLTAGDYSIKAVYTSGSTKLESESTLTVQY
ncbi:MAG: hypothetical protein BZ136_05020, partial [Methanosphaera sp. rholeuAM74]